MPPKKAATAPSATSTSVWVVMDDASVDSVHASLASAKSRQEEIDSKESSIVTKDLEGGTITVTAVAEEKKETKASKPAAAPKTKTPAEQRAANAAKPKSKGDADLPEDVQALLDGEGTSLEGLQICVTGVPPMLGRKNTEALIAAYGGKLMKSLSKNTTFVVVGNDAGPKKLDQIETLGLETKDESEFIAMLEEGDEEPKAKKAKK